MANTERQTILEIRKAVAEAVSKGIRPIGGVEPSEAERRLFERANVNLKARFLRGDSEEHACVIQNISAAGLFAETDCDLAVGETIVIYIDKLNRFEGRVARAGDGCFGLQFDITDRKLERTAQALEAILAGDNHQYTPERREKYFDPEARRFSSKRIKITLGGRFLRENGAEAACQIQNISIGGLFATTDTPPEDGETLIIYVDELYRFQGKVVRTEDSGFGFQFETSAHKKKKIAATLAKLIHSRLNPSDEAPEPAQPEDVCVTLADNTQRSARVTEMRPDGLRIEIEPRPAVGERIRVGELEASVTTESESGVDVELLDRSR